MSSGSEGDAVAEEDGGAAVSCKEVGTSFRVGILPKRERFLRRFGGEFIVLFCAWGGAAVTN